MAIITVIISQSIRRPGRGEAEPCSHSILEPEDEEIEEITIVRRINRVTTNTYNSISNTIDAYTPEPVRVFKERVTAVVPVWLVWLIFISLLLLILWATDSLPSVDSVIKSSSSLSSAIITPIASLASAASSKISGLFSSMSPDERILLESSNNEMYRTKVEEALNSFKKDFDIKIRQRDEWNRERDERLARLEKLQIEKTSSDDLIADQLAQVTKTCCQTEEELKALIEKHTKSFLESFRQSYSGTFDEDKMKKMISDALILYDADKTGQPDFALEPAGGTVINTRCSETYNPHTATYKILGVPIWRSSPSPRTVIQPSMAPGECWAFKGYEGRIVIKLSQVIVPTSITYEHIPKQISRDGNIDSAPKKFQVLGLADEKDTEGTPLGSFEYLDNGYPLQTFDIQNPDGKKYQIIEFHVLSNHGNLEYTCLYRFRVHGKRVYGGLTP